jgi:ankyrin repeat protein
LALPIIDRAPLPFPSPLAAYETQARLLLDRFQQGDSLAVKIFHENHPRFLDEKIVWLPKRLDEEEIKATPLTLDDARLAVARAYCFLGWSRLAEWVAAAENDPKVFQFESAVEAVIGGDEASLASLLRRQPELVQERSTIVSAFDPSEHRATLLHYVAANGVEHHRQESPKNAVAIARLLLEAGANPNALAWMYGGQWTTLSLLVSSSHPAEAGVQVALVELLVDFGAAVDRCGEGKGSSPLRTALVFGFIDAAESLLRRGADADSIVEAAGLGRLDEVRAKLAGATAEERHFALALAAQLGRLECVRALLDAGENPNRYNPSGGHAHATPLHQAVYAGHEEVVQVLVQRGARLDMKDTIYQSTPLGWAEHGGQTKIAEFLRTAAND